MCKARKINDHYVSNKIRKHNVILRMLMNIYNK